MASPSALVSAPRHVPWSLRVQVVLSGVVPLLGWIILGVGVVLSSLFLRISEPIFNDPFAGRTHTLEGRLVKVEATAAKINDDTVQAVHFEYAIGDRSRLGVSYTTGAVPDVGATVTVEYVRGQPTTARIRGMRTAMFPAVTGFVLVFPAIGVLLLLLGVRQGWRRVGLLQNGVLARGRLVGSRPTNTKINNQRVHELTFEFVDAANRARRGVVRTHRLHAVTDEPEEVLLYEPDGPRIVLWDMLPSHPELDRDGNFLPAGLGRLVPVLLPPTIVAVVLSLSGSLLDGLPG